MMTENNRHLDLSDHFEVVLRYKHLIIAFCLSATLTSLGLTYVTSEKYRAAASLLYRPQQNIRFQAKQQEALGFPVPMLPLETIGNTLEEVAKSESVLRKVVETLGLDKEQEIPPGFKGLILRAKAQIRKTLHKTWQILKYGRTLEDDAFASAVQGLQEGKLFVRLNRKAYTFNLEALDSDPKRAAAIVDTAAKVLADVLQQNNTREARKVRQDLESRLAENRQDILSARSQLESYKKRNRLSSFEEETKMQLQFISLIEGELARVGSELRGLDKKRAELSSQLAQLPPQVKYTSTTTDNPVVMDLKLEQARLEVQRSGMLEKYSPQHQEVKAVDAKLAEVRERLRSETEKVVSSESSRVNDVYQKLQTDKLAADADARAFEVRRAALEEMAAEARKKSLSITAKEAGVGQLTLNLQAAEQTQLLLSEAYEEARIAESRGVSEVTVLSPAAIPTSPEQPIKILYVSISFFLSLSLGIGVAFVMDYLDPSLRKVHHIEQTLNIPILATIPMTKESPTAEIPEHEPFTHAEP